MNPGEWFQPAQRKQFDAWPEQRPDEPQQPDEPPQQPQLQRTHDQVEQFFYSKVEKGWIYERIRNKVLSIDREQ